jgi:hypothetical protein
VLISAAPGGGGGAGFAGRAGADPGERFAAGPPAASIRHGGHELPLWHLDAPGRAAFAGEVMGSWLWLVLWPAVAGVLLADTLQVRDLRDPGQQLDLPFGALSPQLPA